MKSLAEKLPYEKLNMEVNVFEADEVITASNPDIDPDLLGIRENSHGDFFDLP